MSTRHEEQAGRGGRDRDPAPPHEPSRTGVVVLTDLAWEGAQRLRGASRAIAGGAGWLLGLIADLTGALLGAGAVAVERAARLVTPVRALAAVTLAGALLLAGAQFADYSGVAVGAADYREFGDEGVAPAALVDPRRTGEAHAWVLLPAAGLAIAALGLAMLVLGRARRRLCLLIAAIGLGAIVVSLAVDLPAGLDAGSAGVAYEGAEARLLAGFWAQLAAAALLVCGGLLLAREPSDTSRTSSAPRPSGTFRRGSAGTLRPGVRGASPRPAAPQSHGTSSASPAGDAGDGAPPVSRRAR